MELKNVLKFFRYFGVLAAGSTAIIIVILGSLLIFSVFYGFIFYFLWNIITIDLLEVSLPRIEFFNCVIIGFFAMLIKRIFLSDNNS